MAREGPWRAYSRGASRRLKPKYVHYQYMRIVSNGIYTTLLCMYVLWPMFFVRIILGVYFSQVENKPWIPWDGPGTSSWFLFGLIIFLPFLPDALSSLTFSSWYRFFLTRLHPEPILPYPLTPYLLVSAFFLIIIISYPICSVSSPPPPPQLIVQSNTTYRSCCVTTCPELANAINAKLSYPDGAVPARERGEPTLPGCQIDKIRGDRAQYILIGRVSLRPAI